LLLQALMLPELTAKAERVVFHDNNAAMFLVAEVRMWHIFVFNAHTFKGAEVKHLHSMAAVKNARPLKVFGNGILAHTDSGHLITIELDILPKSCAQLQGLSTDELAHQVQYAFTAFVLNSSHFWIATSC
jgi:hypothetical protein